MNLRALALLLAIALLGGAAFAGLAGGDDRLGEMSIEPLGDAVRVARGDDVLSITAAASLEPGDLISTRKTGARLRLEGDRNVWIAPSSRVLVVDTRIIEDRGGSVLVDTADYTGVRVGDALATSSNGVFRVDRQVATARAATYRGSLSLTSPGDARMDVPVLYQASIVAGDFAPPKPYQVSVEDVWDGQWLEDVVALEDDLDRLAAGFSNQLDRARPRLADFRRVIDRPVGFMRPYVRRPPADVFIAYAIADRAPDTGLRPAFKQAFALRDDEGSWGVIAAIMDVEPRPLVASVEELFLDTGVVDSDGSDQATFASASEPAGSGDSAAITAAPSPDTPQPPPDGGSGSPPPEDDEPKKKKKDDPPDDECEGTIDCAAQELPLPDLPVIP